MKVSDIDKVNHLIAELNGVKELVTHAERAEPVDFELFIKLPADASIRMSSEGAASAHYSGFVASPEFLASLQRVAIEDSTRGGAPSSRNSRHWAWRQANELVRRPGRRGSAGDSTLRRATSAR
jgi:hypothetical protein